jgi:hypothetical protein
MKPTDATAEQVENAFASATSLRELVCFFSDRETLLSRYAQYISGIFPADRKVSGCECCRRHSDELTVQFHWRGIYHTAGTFLTTVVGILAAMGGHGILAHRHIDFTTTHGLCNRCYRQIRIRKVVGQALEKLCFALIIVSIIILVPVLVFAPFMLSSGATRREVAVVAIGLGGGAAGLMAGWLGADRIVRWCVPGPLKLISKRPFQLNGVNRISP